MKMIRASVTLGLVALTAVAAPFAMADDSGLYIGGNIGQSRATIDEERIVNSLAGAGFTTTGFEDDNRDLGFKLFGGYQFNKYLALEGGYFDLGKFDFTATGLPPGTLSGNIKIKGVNLDVVGILPITEKFSAFGRVGANYAKVEDSFVGGGYRIDDAVGNDGDIDLISAGLVFRFGGAPPAAPRAEEPAPEPVAKAVVAEPVPVPVPAPAPVVVPPPAPRFQKYTLSVTELFAFDSAELQKSQPKLDEIANVLMNDSTIDDVLIVGYTDRIGSDTYNQKLSERRAQAIKKYLVGRGVKAERLVAKGKGKSSPIASCTGKKNVALIKCLAPNRRVEIEKITATRPVK
ncbi:MAG: flagellar motor protein MotB [Deltaproteobacteria bacterium HGW-Deltaproteobacteria-3]|nr:MAG: flagellar motor protein MotB [Deltaproteobacteria bacterium HGW-Deltaproteobacteria-3]